MSMFPRSVVLVAGCLFLIVFWVLLSGVYNYSDGDIESTVPTVSSSSKLSSQDDSLSETIAELKAQLTSLEQNLPKLISNAISGKTDIKPDNKVAHVADNKNDATKKSTSTKKRRLAYAFYATNNDYACASLILAKSIEDVGGKSRPDIEWLVLYTPEVDEKFVTKFKESGFNLYATKPIENEAVGPYHALWKHSVTKLLVFNMTDYDRIIFLDADAIAMKSPDFLFDLPPHFLYAPRAYWLWDIQPWINSQMLVLEPSEMAFQKQMDFFNTNEKEGKVFYDMDIANEVFRNHVSVLPGTYQLVNTDLVQPGSNKVPTLFDKTVDQIVKEAFIIHFTEGPNKSYGKPWHVNSMAEVEIKEEAHPVFKEMYQRWFDYRDKLCF